MLENMLLDQLSRKLGRKIEADVFKMNQFTGEIELGNLKIYNESGTEVQVTLESGRASLNVMDLMQKKLTIEHAQIDSLHIKK